MWNKNNTRLYQPVTNLYTALYLYGENDQKSIFSVNELVIKNDDVQNFISLGHKDFPIPIG